MMSLVLGLSTLGMGDTLAIFQSFGKYTPVIQPLMILVRGPTKWAHLFSNNRRNVESSMVIRIIGEVFDQFSQLNVRSRIYVKGSLRCKRKMTIQLIRVEAQRLWARLKNSVNDLPYFTWLVWVKRFLNKSFTDSLDSSFQFFPYWTKVVSLCIRTGIVGLISGSVSLLFQVFNVGTFHPRRWWPSNTYPF